MRTSNRPYSKVPPSMANAHFEGAKLRGASFRSHRGQNADLEGANFRGADLRDADFRGASLFAVTFCPEPGDSDVWGPALIDRSTRFSEEAIEKLTPLQEHFVRQALS